MDPELAAAFKRRGQKLEQLAKEEQEELPSASASGKENGQTAAKEARRSSTSKRRDSKKTDDNQREKRRSQQAELKPGKNGTASVGKTKDQTSLQTLEDKPANKARRSLSKSEGKVTSKNEQVSKESCEKSKRRHSKSSHKEDKGRHLQSSTIDDTTRRSKELKSRKSDVTSTKDEIVCEKSQSRHSKRSTDEKSRSSSSSKSRKSDASTKSKRESKEAPSSKKSERRSSKGTNVEDTMVKIQASRLKSEAHPAKPKEYNSEDSIVHDKSRKSRQVKPAAQKETTIDQQLKSKNNVETKVSSQKRLIKPAAKKQEQKGQQLQSNNAERKVVNQQRPIKPTPKIQAKTAVKEPKQKGDKQACQSPSLQVKKTTVVKSTQVKPAVRKEQKTEKPIVRAQAQVVKAKKSTNKQAISTQLPQVKKESKSQELQGKKKVVKKDIKTIDVEAPRHRSAAEAPLVDKHDYYEEEKHSTCWKKHNQKFCCVVLLLLLTTLAFLIMSLVQFRLKHSNSPNRPFGPYNGAGPTPSPSTLQPTAVPPIKIYLEDVIGFSFESREAPFAVSQLVREATANGGDGEVPLTPKTIQRFALINMDLALVSGTPGISITGQSDFTWGQFGQDECEWPGVECNDNEEVTSIRLGGKGLTGTIPSAVGLLTSLKVLEISNNNVYGSLPEELYNVESLEKLFLYKNVMTGSISTNIGNLWNLTDFVAHSNQLTGTIPNTMKSGSRGIFGIRYFNVFNNQMTGTIPANLKLRHLYYLDLGKNNFEGKLPADLGVEYVRLRHLFLDNNAFTGTVPDSVVNAGDGRLRSLSLNDNQFVGPLPGNHMSNTFLNTYEVQNNNFTSMHADTCKLWIFSGGELVDFNSDCAICDCGDKSTMCQNCSN